MGDPPMSPFGLPPGLVPPLPPPPKSNLPMLYYGLVVVGTAAVVLAVYNLLIIKWCTHRPPTSIRAGPRFVEITGGNSQSFDQSSRGFLPGFKYKKGTEADDGELECAVCLSAVEDGEEVRRLPRCKHTFHVSCIDMWLYSHSDCPLCRAPAVHPLSRGLREPVNSPELSREGLLQGSMAISF